MTLSFRKATDDLFVGVSHEDLKKALGCSVATIRQARLDESAKAHRRPPEGWERAVAKIAQAKAAHFNRLVERLGR
jgi:hypothetical protein